MAKEKKLSFEGGMRELEEIVRRVEQGELPLEEVVASYERGILLVKELEGMLKTGQGRIEKLMKDGQREELDRIDEDV